LHEDEEDERLVTSLALTDFLLPCFSSLKISKQTTIYQSSHKYDIAILTETNVYNNVTNDKSKHKNYHSANYPLLSLLFHSLKRLTSIYLECVEVHYTTQRDTYSL
jgi:CRISPR/Cas system endoribonuclease Cas6 (RAMP superfamily)